MKKSERDKLRAGLRPALFGEGLKDQVRVLLDYVDRLEEALKFYAQPQIELPEKIDPNNATQTFLFRYGLLARQAIEGSGE